MNRRTYLAAVCASLVVLAGAPAARAQQQAAAGKFVVGYSAAGLIDDLQITWSKAVRKAVEDAGGTLLLVDSRNQISKQISDIEDLLVKGIKVLVINPVDDAGIGPAIAAANAANVPVVTIDRNGGKGKITARVGFDNYRAGFEAGEFIAQRVHGTGEVAQLEGQAGGADVRDRGQGFRDAIAKHPGMRIVAERFTDWNTAKAQAATDDILVAHPNIVGIWAHADAIIMGAVQSLEAAGKDKQVVTVGMGMYAGGPEAIKAGRLTASWYLYPKQLGKTAGDVVVKIAHGESVPEFVHTPMTFVTKANVDEFLGK